MFKSLRPLLAVAAALLLLVSCDLNPQPDLPGHTPTGAGATDSRGEGNPTVGTGGTSIVIVVGSGGSGNAPPIVAPGGWPNDWAGGPAGSSAEGGSAGASAPGGAGGAAGDSGSGPGGGAAGSGRGGSAGDTIGGLQERP